MLKMKWAEYHEEKAFEVYRWVKSILKKENISDFSISSHINSSRFHDFIKQYLETDRVFTCSFASFLMKLQNFCYLDTGKGLSNVSYLSQKIFNQSNRVTLLFSSSVRSCRN